MPKITLSGPADLLTAIPFQLGFRPASSVVVVCFHAKRLGLVVRVDVVPREQAHEAADQLLPALLRESPSSVALVGFEERAGESMPLSDALVDALDAAGLDLRDRLVVRGGRWYALDCDCCPAEGTPMPEPAEVSAVASYVALGRTVLPGRSHLSLLVEPLGESAPRHGLAKMAIEAWQERFAWSRLHEVAHRVGAAVEGGRGDVGGDGAHQGSASARSARAGSARVDVDGDGPDARGSGEADPMLPDPMLPDAEEADAPEADGRLPRSARDDSGLDDSALPDWTLPDSELDDSALEESALDDSELPDWMLPDSGLDDMELGDSEPELSPRDFMVTEALVAWGGLLRGEIAGHGLEHWVPALVAPLRDPDVRDALIAWICPGALPLDSVDDDLRALLELHLGHEVRLEDLEQDGGARRPGDPEPSLAETSGWPDDDWEAACAPKMLQARLESLCRVTPATHAPPLLSVVASFAWWAGDGARARVAVDRALELEPDHRLCRLIGDALDRGLRARSA